MPRGCAQLCGMVLRVPVAAFGAGLAHGPLHGGGAPVADQRPVDVAVVVQRRCDQFGDGGRRRATTGSAVTARPPNPRVRTPALVDGFPS